VSTANAGGYSATQTRTISTALDLFARHGVAGTSLQMIADALGVTKAAVYHQFKTKDEIVLAVADAELARLASVIEAAEAQPSAAQARDELVVRIVDLAVEHRHALSAILSDPVITRFYGKHEPFRHVMDGLNRVLMGDDAGPDAGVTIAMLTAAISGAVMHPLVVDLDDDTLRSQLLRLARRFLDIPA
jgi:AcrR family transcriptional regulator